MAETFGIGTTIIPALPYQPFLDCPQAGEIITAVRDLIPDPVYTDAGEPQPDTDGSFLRASSLYRFLTMGIRELTRRTNWTVQDWTAVSQTPRQQIYRLNMRFVNVDACFCNQYRLLHLDEVHTIYPSYAVAQPLWFSWHHRSDHLELSLWPAPDRQDPTAVLMTTIGPTDASAISLNTTEGFLPFGWVKIDGEMMQYSELWSDAGPPATQGLRVVRRGVSGTAAALHFAGAPVEHLSIWTRGIRSPNPVMKSTDCLEIPEAFTTPLETYLLAKCKEAEQDRAGARSLMEEFREQVNSIVTDPAWQQTPWPSQVRAYGMAEVGGLAYGRVVVP